MAKNMSNCFLCGAEYEVCKMCSQIKHYTPWRMECDSPRHWQIYVIVKDLRKGLLKPDEAKEQLEQLKVTLEEVKTFVASVQETLLPLYEVKEVVVETEEVVKVSSTSKKNVKKR